MSLILSQFSNWDDTKIELFIEFKKLMQSSLPTYFPETVEEYKKFLHPDSPFAKDYQWSGFLIHKNKKVVGKAILSWRNGSRIGNLGFIDWENNPEVAKLLTTKIEAYAKSLGLTMDLGTSAAQSALPGAAGEAQHKSMTTAGRN